MDRATALFLLALVGWCAGLWFLLTAVDRTILSPMLDGDEKSEQVKP